MENNIEFRWTALRLMLVILIVMQISCSEDKDVIENSQLDSSTELKFATEIDQMDYVLEDLILQAVATEESDISDRPVSKNIPPCATVTIVAQQNFREITLDFGAEGCLVNGHMLQGQIIIDYTRNPDAQEITINYNLVDFYFDAKNLIGTRSILRELANENGHPQFTHNLNLTVIWPNGVQASREGTKVREWIEGFGNGILNDNVFEITGDWTAVFVNGNTHIYEVQTPLRREFLCSYFVSGTVDVQRTNFGGILNYGNGECDNQATFTFNNGEQITILLN